MVCSSRTIYLGGSFLCPVDSWNILGYSVDEGRRLYLNGFLKFIKIVALFIPTVVSGILLCIVIIRFNPDMTDVQLLESKMNITLSIIGIAITVWIGLNIYNLIERKELESLQEELKKLGQMSESFKKDQEYLSKQLQISGSTLFLQTKMIEQRNWLQKERSLVYGSEFSYIDYIEGFVLRFEEYARENSKLENRYRINWGDLYFDLSDSITFFITETISVNGGVMRANDILQIDKVLTIVDSIFRDELFNRLDFENYENDMDILSSTNFNTLHFIESIKGDEILMVRNHIKEQEELIKKMLKPYN